MFVMFHLTLVGPDDVCAEHGRGAHSAQMPGHHAAGDAAIDRMSHGESDRSCQTPSSAHCCEAVTSCAVTLAVAERAIAPATPAGRGGVPAAVTSALLSRSLAPEPPPPKA
jgi:hypothetical protein